MSPASRPTADLTPFGRWLMDRLDEREMTRADLARAVGRSSGLVAKWLYSNAPLPASCDRIAAALMLPVDQVLEAAGHRPVASPQSDLRREAQNLLTRIPEPLLVPLIAMLRGLARDADTTLRSTAEAIANDR